MPDDTEWNEPLVEQTVTYHIEIDGKLYLIEYVPAGSHGSDSGF